MPMVGVISDTHGRLRPEAAEALRGVDRILHAGGDATGAEIVRVLGEAVAAHRRVVQWSDAFVVDLLTDDDGR